MRNDMIWLYMTCILRKLHVFSLECNVNSFKSQINKFTNEPLNPISNQKPECQPPVSAYHFSFQLKEFLCQTQLPIFPIFSDRHMTIYCNFPKLQSETFFWMRQSKRISLFLLYSVRSYKIIMKFSVVPKQIKNWGWTSIFHVNFRYDIYSDAMVSLVANW